MRVLAMVDVRADLRTVVDRVIEDCEPAIMPRESGGAAVIVSWDNWTVIAKSVGAESPERLLD